MQKTFTRLLLTALSCVFLTAAQAQTIITQWNFNSNPPDASNSTGSLTASTGNGTLATIGGVTGAFGSGSANGGSSDPATTDNTGYQTTGYPAASANNKTAGIQFAASTVGYSNIVVSYDLRHSGTSSRYELLQYTTDITAATPVWVDAQTFDGPAGDTWFNNRSVNLSSVTTLNNNPNAGFRIVSVFAPSTTAYGVSSSASTYAGSGTWRFDMVTVKTVPPPSISFVGTNTTVSETTTTVDITARIQNGGASPATADLVLNSFGTANANSDFVLPATARFSWPADANNVNATVSITINNDMLAENTEYFTLQLANAVNADLPASSSNNFTVYITDDDKAAPIATRTATLNHLASFSNGAAGANSAEIVAHDPATQRLFIANSIAGKLDIVNFANPTAASLITSVSMAPYGGINSVAVRNGIVAVAIEDAVPENPGKVVFFTTSGVYVNQVIVGALPDMIVFNNAGTKVLTANEGQPKADYTVDPEGSVSIIDISGGVAGLTQAAVTTASFTSFNAQAASLKASGVRIFGLNNPTVAQDLEPEYITISADDNTAWVTCQENNAIAEINLTTGTVTAIRALGTKDHSLAKNALDASDEGGAIQIANWPIKGLYMPDAIASYSVGGQTYLVTANEGDAREYTAYEEATRLSNASYTLDPTAFPNAVALKAAIGRLNVSKASGDIDGDGDYDEIHAFGGRSFSIWNATTGALVWDSGDELESIIAKHPSLAAIFNASNANNNFKNRSDDKGPEPEGVTVAQVAGRTYAFIALERIGGCMVYDITNPSAPLYVDYKNTRNVTAYGGDNGAEGILYIAASASPTNQPLVILANEVSSTLTFFQLEGATGAPLDIDLVNVKAQNIGARNRVEWMTANEEQGDAFELQRSADGVRFTALSTITARGAASTYSYWDEAPVSGVNYYRLKLKHRSGIVTYSAIVSAMVGGSMAVAISPNPAKDRLTVKLNAIPSIEAQLEIIDAAGRVVKRIKPTSVITTVDVQLLSRGWYSLRYVDAGKVEIVRLVKE